MKSGDFVAYKQTIMTQLIAMQASSPPHTLDEQAVPSYTHRNPVIRDLFWRRIQIVMEHLENLQFGNVLDFGCGAGILLPFLRAHSQGVVAFDVDPLAAQEMIQRLSLPNMRLIGDFQSLRRLSPQSFDTILALDVLEHVDDLAEICRLFRDLLPRQGTVIVSGPTESWLYRLGRRIAGYMHHFRKRDIYAVERELAQYFRLQQVMRLYPGATFFRISVWKLE